MRHFARADDVRIVSDEAGWEMLVVTEDGDEFTFNIHGVAHELAERVRTSLWAWRLEGEEARAETERFRDLVESHPDATLDLIRDIERAK